MIDAQRRKKFGDAFAMIGKKDVKMDVKHAFDFARFSGLWLRDALCALRALTELLEILFTISIADIPNKPVEIKEYIVYRYLVENVLKKLQRRENGTQQGCCP